MIKTVRLETAKALKEAGFKQDDSSFYFVNWGKVQVWQCRHKEYIDKYWDEVVDKGYTTLAAPTTDELLEELPQYLDSKNAGNLTLESVDFGKQWSLFYPIKDEFGEDSWLHEERESSLPEALAAMWLFLKKEGLLK